MTERIICNDAGGELREEIVRCRDCKRFGPETSDHEYRGEWWCELFMTDLARPDGFCAWGRRRATLADLYGVWKEDE